MLRALILVLLVAFPLGMGTAPGIASVNGQRVGIESVNNWKVEVEVDDPYPTDCRSPTSTQNGDTVITTIPCRTYSGARIPKRGVVVEAFVELLYRQSGEFIDECEASRVVTQRGRFNLKCSTTLRAPAKLPLEFSGSGTEIVGPFLLPGGKLIVETSFDGSADGYNYIDVEIHQDSGDTYYASYGEGPFSGRTEIIDVYQTDSALLHVDVYGQGSWTVRIRDAFPDE
jgi:hypothetical protein